MICLTKSICAVYAANIGGEPNYRCVNHHKNADSAKQLILWAEQNKRGARRLKQVPDQDGQAGGVSAAKLKISAVGGAPARQVMLKDGKIDAGMQPMPLNLEAEALGFNNLGWAGKYEPEWRFITIDANSEWVRKNPRIATGVLPALLRGQQFIWWNPEEAARIAAAVLKTDAALAQRSLAEAVELGILDPKLDWSELGLQHIYENMQADGSRILRTVQSSILTGK